MRPLSHWPLNTTKSFCGILTDIDDTLTTEGAITQDALDALATLRAAGLRVIAITGRPAGWSAPFAASWPVDAIVAETGAVALLRAPENSDQIGLQTNPDKRQQLSKWYLQDAPTRSANFARMQQVARQILEEVPGAQLARDSAGRETDIAIDHSEFTRLPQAAIDEVVRIMRSEGMTATVSSIHINGWYGGHSKLSGARWIVRELLGRELDAELDRWVYVGDSTNDVLMFEHFPHSVGVANIRRFESQLTHPPRYITPGERGAGFAQLAQAILQSQKSR